MSQGTTFRIFAKDLRDEFCLSKEKVREMAVEDSMRETSFRERTKEDAERYVDAGRKVRYLPIYEPRKEGDIGGNFVRTPFANWVDTSDGRICYEVVSYDFASDFTELYEHYGLDAYSWHDSVEIGIADVEKMLAVVNYILNGEYSRKVEEAVFRGNQFFRILEEQFVSFSERFRKSKKANGGRKSAKNDERDGDDPYYDSEMEGIRKNDMACCTRLRDILSGFLSVVDSLEYTVDAKYISYHLAYFKW